MSPLRREDLIELGVSVPTDVLIRWSTRQLAGAKGRESRLESRGLTRASLAGAADLLQKIEKHHQGLGKETLPVPQAVTLARRIQEEAMEFRQEACRIAAVEFGTNPDVLARFRRGVRTGLLLENLARELDLLLPLLREYSPNLAGLGATEAFLQRGALLVQRLRDVKAGLDAACRDLSQAEIEHGHDKGILYDLVRRLVRIGQLEFHLDPEQASAFSFNEIRKAQGAARAGRAVSAGAGARQPL